MTQSPLLTVGSWQKKSLEEFCQSQDRLISAINKGFNAMAAVLSKDTHPDEVQCALAYLHLERSLALQFDKTKDDSLRSLVYGLLESLNVSLIEWTEERNQRRAIGEISTQAENESALSLLGPLIPPCDNEASLPMGNNVSNLLSTISDSELMRDEMIIKEEEMDNEIKELVPHSNPIFHGSLDVLDQGLNLTLSLPFNSVVDPMYISQNLPRDNQMPPSNELRDELDFKEEEMPIDDVIIPRNSMGEELRRVCYAIQYAASPNHSDCSVEPSMKNSGSESTVKKRKSYKGEEESEDVVKKRRVSKTNETELECPECKYRTRTVKAWVDHLRNKHSTTPTLAGLALLCECGNESVSDAHARSTNHCNTTVIRKREGPIKRIDDAKATIKCVLCEIYPKTACGYVQHLDRHHKSTLAKNGVYLKCSCGLEIRSSSYGEHADECNPRQFTLHKLDDE